MINRQPFRALFGILLIGLIALPAYSKTNAAGPTRYLAFQVFTAAPSPHIPIGGNGSEPLSAPPSKAEIKQLVQQIVAQIGDSGDATHKLAFIVGPLAFDQTDAQIQQLVQDSFEVARELNIAVGFHIDDSMFWARRSDLWRDPKNIEWLDWDSPPSTGRQILWGPQPTKLAPQMCFNSPTIQGEVTRLASDVIGGAIRKGIDQLAAQGKPDLFAGVIAGWETQIAADFDTNRLLGYCALTNLGYSRAHPPQDLDAEREKVVQAFIELWAAGLKQAGIDPAKIYSHTALLSRFNYYKLPRSVPSYSAINHFAPLEVSIGANYQPGFSTYPQTAFMQQLYELFQKNGNPNWASSEGSIVMPATLTSRVSTETYLGWMFNHNATLLNIFGWGVGDAENPFWKAAASPEAIAAYRKFLSGQPLTEDMTDQMLDENPLTTKIRKINSILPVWLPKHPDQQDKIKALMSQLDKAVKAGDYQGAQATADTILSMIGS